jgi:hypothetical protein
VSEPPPEKDEFAGLPLDWVVCNCSHCGCLLSGRSMRDYALNLRTGLMPKGRPPLATHSINGRPVCSGCYSPNPAPKASRRAPREEAPPSWDDAVRALEEDR